MKKVMNAILMIMFLMLSVNTFAGKGEKKESKEYKIKFEALPQSVKDSFKQIDYEKITEVEKEVKHEKVTYEVEYISEGKKFEAKFDASGKLLEIEEDDDEDDDDDDDDDEDDDK
jgi:hypothetical protein